MPSILIIDDDAVFCEVLANSLKRKGYVVWSATAPYLGLKLARKHLPDRVILDLRLDDLSGLEIIKPLLAINNNVHILVLTGYASLATAVHAIKLGAHNYLSKPADTSEILAAFKASNNTAGKVEVEDHSISLRRMEWEHIQFLLKKNDGNISATARELGMHRRTLQRKLQKRPGKW